MAKIGFIGLGIMGTPIAKNLLGAGHELVLFSRSGVPQELIAAGGIAVASPRAVATEARIVFLMVPNTSNVEEVLFGTAGIAGGLSDGQIVVDLSSISPTATRSFAARVEERGAVYLDAPVSGGEVGAQTGLLSIMVGGPQSAFRQVRPLLEIMGKNITHVGPNGAGQITKIANQTIVAANLAAVAEALVFASKAGADPEKVRRALLGGFASSRVLELHGVRMTQRSFEPGFRIELHQKDLTLAATTAQEVGVSLPVTGVSQQLFAAAAQHCGEKADHSAVLSVFEALSGHQIHTNPVNDPPRRIVPAGS